MAKKKTKAETIDEAVVLLGKIEAKEAEVETASRELDEARETAKTKKGVWLTKVDELRALCRTRKRWAAEAKRQPLLNQKAAKGEPGDDSPLLAAAEQVAAAKTAPVDWRKLPIDKLSLTKSALAKFGERDILTLGDFQTFQGKHGDFWGKELGLHGKQKEVVTDAWERFWADNPAYCQEAPQAA